MLEQTQTKLQFVNDQLETITPLAGVVAGYTEELRQRRQQLCDDLAYFEIKLQDIEQLDPLDFTGLVKVYSEHARHIRALLDEFDQNHNSE